MAGASSFRRRCADMASHIRRGGLREQDDVSQVLPRSYEPLACINELGMLTIDSQDGQTDERAYVMGLMPAARAHAFAEALNCASDKVAVVLQPCSREMRSRVALTRFNGSGITNLPLYLQTREYNFLVTSDGYGGLPRGADVLVLECFDPVWARRAYARRGLFADIIAALTTTVHTVRTGQATPTRKSYSDRR